MDFEGRAGEIGQGGNDRAFGRQAVRRGLLRLLDAVLPPRCLACGAPVSESGAACAECWSRIAFLEAPFCAVCGFPFEIDTGPQALCGACARRRPAFARARAVMRYDEASRRLVLMFKHADRTDAAPAFARWMLRAGRELLDEADLIAPVPLHRRRLFTRRYNQAALLALELARRADRPVVPDLLVRRRFSRPQGRLGRAARVRNVAGAFAVKPARADLLEGRRVVLVDDVLTTGATAASCARALLDGGAAAVDVLTLARVVRGAAAS